MLTKLLKILFYGGLVLMLIPFPPMSSVIYAQARGDTSGISLTANAAEFNQGDSYVLKLVLHNEDGDEILAGSKVVLSIPDTVLDYSSLDLSDVNLTNLFDISVDKANGQVIFTTKTNIVGQVDVSGNISGTVIGEKGKTYDVGSDFVLPDGSAGSLINNNPTITVKTDEPIPPTYGFLNSYWGLSPTDAETFIGKNSEDIGGLPTGNFSRSKDELTNFSEINVGGIFSIDSSYYYTFFLEVRTDENVPEPTIDQSSIIVTDETTGRMITNNNYTVEKLNGKNQILVTFKSATASNGEIIGGNHQYMVGAKIHVFDSSAVYETISDVYVMKGPNNPYTDAYQFQLNNQFTQDGDSTIFPTLTAPDKTYHVGDLTTDNINEKLLEEIKAQDTMDGDISGDIQIDYGNLLDKANIIGDYKDQVTYSVTNSTNHVSKKTITVHIIDKAAGAPVTVKYVDTDNKAIAGVDTETLNGKVGEPYHSKEKTIPGYQLITPPNADGVFTDKAQEVIYQYQGALIFTNAPRTLDFGEHKLSTKDEIYSLEKKDKDLTVQDNRSLGSDWEMRATLTKELTDTKSGSKLSNSLHYEGEKSEELELGIPIVIKDTKTDSHDDVNLSEHWLEENQGLKLKVKTGKASVGTYSGEIRWDLYDTVAND